MSMRGDSANFFRALCGVALVVAVGGCATRPVRTAESLYQEGVAFLKAGRLREAAWCFHEAAFLDPTHLPSFQKEAEAWARLGQAAKVLDVCRRARSLGLHDPALLLSEGEALVELGRAHEALRTFDEVLSSSPENAWALCGKGIALAQLLDRYQEGLACLKKACTLNPRLTRAWNCRLSVYLSLKDLRNAWKVYREALGAGVLLDQKSVQLLKKQTGVETEKRRSAPEVPPR